MKKLYFLLICFCLNNILANCQNIITGEYFIDKDPGLGKGVPIILIPADTIKSVSVPVNSAGLSVGYHYVFIRVKDSYGHWGNYRLKRFYVYNNDSIPPNEDSVYLVQAEYFIDAVPTPGKGKLIDLPHVNSISYDDSIPGFVADNLIHSIGVRVKDNKGAWSFIKADTVPTGGLEISVTASPYIRQNEKTKYSITIKNNRSTDLFDIFLIVRPTNLPNTGVTNASLNNDADTINGVDVKSVNSITQFNGQQYIPIWIYSIPSQKEKTFDFYMNVVGEYGHQLLNQEFEIYYDFEDIYKPLFRINGDTSDFKSSRLFSIMRNTIYLEQDAVQAFMLPDSVITKKLDLIFKSISGLLDNPVMINKIVKPIVSNGFGLNISDSLSDIFARDCFAFLRRSFFADDDPEEETEDTTSFIKRTTDAKCSPCMLDCPIPVAPLTPVNSFYISSYPCIQRCYCQCGTDGYQHNNPGIHGGMDISLNRNTASEKEKEKWDQSKYDVIAIYDGKVVYADYEYEKDENGDLKPVPTKGFGYHVTVETQCKGTKFTTIYGHLNPDNKAVKVGDSVYAGKTIIGWANHTGINTGPHLHLEIRKNGVTCNPNDLFSVFEYKPRDEDAKKEEKCVEPQSTDCVDEHFDKCTAKKEPYKLHLGSCKPISVAKDCSNQEHITPTDPNDKTGIKGYGTPQYITKDAQLHYGILFENKDSASAPAQVVTIKDTLDKNKIDVISLRIESVTAGEMLVVLPDSVHIQNLDTIYTKQPINGTYVHVQTTFDTSSGILEFKMTSLDTFTLQPVTDPLLGFLPPDSTNFDGSGLVSFKVMPKSTIADGTVIYNTAHIIFDVNAPIATGTWFNTIDKSAPSSHVDSLPQITYDTSFSVSWKGKDKGAGIIYYDIYYKKKNDTAYTKWLNETSDTSAIFTGQLDSTYEFYSIAYDSLLNVEDAPDTADALTTISSNVLPITLASFNANCSQTTVSLQWTTASELGIKYFTIEKSINGTNWVPTGKSIQAKTLKHKINTHLPIPIVVIVATDLE